MTLNEWVILGFHDPGNNVHNGKIDNAVIIIGESMLLSSKPVHQSTWEFYFTTKACGLCVKWHQQTQ